MRISGPAPWRSWGLGWTDLSQINPGLVMLRISGYGQTGPYRDLPGFGVIGEAIGGLRHITGEPVAVPVRVGSASATSASLHGVIGVLMALYHRKVNGGRGQYIDIGLYEAVFNMMESTLPEYDALGVVRERHRKRAARHRAHRRLSARTINMSWSSRTATALQADRWRPLANRFGDRARPGA